MSLNLQMVILVFFSDTLLIDYQFTFSLSQEDDRYYTAINFVATPEEVCLRAAAV